MPKRALEETPPPTSSGSMKEDTPPPVSAPPRKKPIRKKSTPNFEEPMKAAASMETKFGEASPEPKKADTTPETPEVSKLLEFQSPEPAKPVDPLLEACRPVLDFLEESARCEKVRTSAEMLIATLPHALELPLGEKTRHPYQEAILDAVEAHLKAFGKLREEYVVESQKELSGIVSERAKLTAEISSTQAKIEEAGRRRQGSAEELKKAEDALAEVDGPFRAADLMAAARREAMDHLRQEKEEWERGADELWTPLKAYLENSRDRNSGIRKLVGRLKKADAEESLLEALPVALKLKPEKRGKHANLALEHGEAEYRQYMATFAEKIESLSAELERCEEAVKSEASLVGPTIEAKNRAAEENKAAEEAWASLVERESSLQVQVHDLDEKKRELEEAPWKIRVEQVRLREASCALKGLRASA